MERGHARSASALHEHAAENLVYIREAMERAGSFTAVPGWGGVFMGMAGLAAAIVAPAQATRLGWLGTWLAAAVVAVTAGVLAIVLKARRARVSLLSGPARQFALSFTPALLAGALLTVALFQSGLDARIPGLWLLSYGTAVVAAGTFSIRIVPLIGALFLFLGTIALFTPPPVPAICLGAGFGGVHIVFGSVIARRYGG